MSKEFPKLIAPVIGIIQDADYSEKTCSLEYVQTGAVEWKISHYRACKLFQVVLSDKSILYVLAEDAAGAIGQASCRWEEPAQSWESQQLLEAGATAIELPMRIRGWGARTF